MKKVLVVYASRHGATRGIAERIASTLRLERLRVTLAAVQEKPDPKEFDAFVIGSGVYFGNWLREAKVWVGRHQKSLRGRPVWLFSSGPVGDVTAEEVQAALLPKSIRELEVVVEPRRHVIFRGAFDPESRPGSIGERVMRMMPSSKDLLPAGDYRNWRDIDAYARDIARALH